MNTLDRINRFIGLFIGSFKNIFAGRIWLILTGYFCINWFILYSHYNFSSPFFYSFVSAWENIFGKEQFKIFTHYPGHFLLLGVFFGWIKFVVGLFLEGLVLGFVAREFYKKYTRPNFQFSKTIFNSWLSLVAGWVIINGLLLIISIQLPVMLKDYLMYSPRRVIIFEYVLMPAIFVFVLSIFYFVIPAIAIYGWSLIKAVKETFKHFVQNPLTCFILSGIILAGPILISFVNNHPEILVHKFKPETVYWFLIIGIAMDMLANFLWMGTAVKFLTEEE